MGNGIRMLLDRAVSGQFEGGSDPALLEEGLPLINQYYAEHCHVDSHLYAGAAELLSVLSEGGKKLALITNKPILHTERIIRHYGITQYFSVIYGGDSFTEKKPSPLPLLKAREALGDGDCLMIGDSITDVQAAQAADIPIICTSFGYNHGAALDGVVSVDQLMDVLDYID